MLITTDIGIVFSPGTNNFSISHDSLVDRESGKYSRLSPFFRRNSWKRTCPPPGSLDKNIFAKIRGGRNFRRQTVDLDRSQIFARVEAIARANLVFPRVCIFFLVYSWRRWRKRWSAESHDRPTDRPIARSIDRSNFFRFRVFRAALHFLLLLEMKLHLARSLKSPWNNIHNASVSLSFSTIARASILLVIEW